MNIFLVCVCVCVCVALVNRHAKRMRYIILSPVAFPAVSDFSTLSHKWQNYRGEKNRMTLNIKRVLDAL